MRKLLPTLILAAALLPAQRFEYWPGAQYDAAMPTVEKVLGVPPGERVLTHAELMKYMEALAAAAPARMRLHEYGKSWEGRKLVYAVIASEANIRRLDEIKAGMKKLADPRKTSEAEAKKIMAALPLVIDLSYGVHGNEISPPDAALLTAYHLLASRNDPLVAAVLEKVVVLIDPLQNPDGRDRFVHNFEANRGLAPDPNAASAEHSEPWPGGRSNHYLFDMNRDWLAATQPETRGRIKYLKEWLPLVLVDLHEMGSDATYFFAPGAAPYNPNLTKSQNENAEAFGKNNGKWFDKFGLRYFTREVYDEFYPGYGASWPWYYGGIGMTYENASVRGLVVRRTDESLYTFRESVQKHFVASVSTCENAAKLREKMLSDFWLYTQTAVSEGRQEAVKEYILARRGDTSAVDKLALLLAEQGLEVKRARAAFKNGGQEYPASSYVVSLAQPRKRMVRAFLDPENPMEQDFLKEQERRRKRKLPDEIYDVTGWSLPLLFNVESVAAAEASQGDFEILEAGPPPAGKVSGRAEVAYLVPWGTQAAGRFLTAALLQGLKVQSANKAFTQAGRKYPTGTLIVQVKANGGEVHDKVAKLASESGAEAVATNTSWVDKGIDFGSNNVITIRKPAIAMLWDSPTSSASAGQTRFVLERQYGYPVTVIRGPALAMADLNRFHVLILPDTGGTGGGYASIFAGPALDRLKNWVREGGVVIGIGGALNFLASPQAGMLAVQQEGLARPPETPTPRPAGSGPDAPASAPITPAPAGAAATPTAASVPAPGKILEKPEDFDKAIRADRELPDPVAGVILRAKVDPEHWITAGLPEHLNVLMNGPAIYTPIKQDKGLNAVVFEGPKDLLASGYLWEENRKQLAYKPFVIVQSDGRGAVVGFTADPAYRAFMDGLNVLLLNAVFRNTPAGGGGGAVE